MSLLRLLADRHKGDVFVPECKDGSSTSAQHAGRRRMDAWVMLKTWSPVTFIGYEIKETRSDWIRDQKFNDYLQLCHLLYVVAQKGVVEKKELPKGVGLLEPIGEGTGQRLVTRVKAARRAIETPVDLLLYVLMSRTRIVAPTFNARDLETQVGRDEAKRLRTKDAEQYAADLDFYHSIDHRIKGRIRTTLEEAIRRTRLAESKAEQLQEVANVLQEIGVTMPQGLGTGYSFRSTVRRQIDQALRGDSVDTLLSALRGAQNTIGGLVGRLEEVRKAPFAQKPTDNTEIPV